MPLISRDRDPERPWYLINLEDNKISFSDLAVGKTVTIDRVVTGVIEKSELRFNTHAIVLLKNFLILPTEIIKEIPAIIPISVSLGPVFSFEGYELSPIPRKRREWSAKAELDRAWRAKARIMSGATAREEATEQLLWRGHCPHATGETLNGKTIASIAVTWKDSSWQWQFRSLQ